MTACVNRKHTKKVAAVVTASLVGALSLGVAPVAAMATDEGIEMQFADPEGAFTNAKVVDAGFSHLGSWRSVGQDGYGVYETTYDAYKPMVLDWFEVEFFGTSESGSFKISAASNDYEVTYYERDSKGMPTGDAITSDIYSVGKYVAKVEAVDGHYKGGVIYVPFDINAIELSGAEVVGSDTVTYNAETHDFRFNLIDSNGVRYTTMEGVDYTVEYVRTGHDATVTTDVKDQGTYVAKITGIGNWAGSVTLSEKITVNPLNLSTTTVVGLTASGDEVEPKNLFGLFIDGKFYTGDDAIMSELKADLTDDEEVWFDNRGYSYDVTEATANDANIDGYATFYASKVEHMLDFYYNGEPVPASHEIIMSDSSTA